MPRFSLDRIVVRHGDSPGLRLALLDRGDLPLEVREVLLGKLAEALRELIVEHGWTTPERAASSRSMASFPLKTIVSGPSFTVMRPL